MKQMGDSRSSWEAGERGDAGGVQSGSVESAQSAHREHPVTQRTYDPYPYGRRFQNWTAYMRRVFMSPVVWFHGLLLPFLSNCPTIHIF